MKLYDPQNQNGHRFITAQDNEIVFQGDVTLSANTKLSDGTKVSDAFDTKADKTSLDELTTVVDNKADQTALDGLAEVVDTKASASSVETLDAAVGLMKNTLTSVQQELATKAASSELEQLKEAVDANTTELTTLNEKKADKEVTDNLTTQTETLGAALNDVSVSLSDLKNSLDTEFTMKPEGSLLGNTEWLWTKINGKFFTEERKVKSISILTRDDAKTNNAYLAVFQRQANSTSMDATTWEFKGISINVPTYVADTYIEWDYSNLTLAANRPVALMATTNPNITSWSSNDTRVFSKVDTRDAADDFSVTNVGQERPWLPTMKFTMLRSIVEVVEDKADKASVDEIAAILQAEAETTAELKDALTEVAPRTPSGNPDGNTEWFTTKISQDNLNTGGKLRKISILCRSDAKTNNAYIAVFQRQEDSTSTDPAQWEFKGVSTNVPELVPNTRVDWLYNDIELAEGRPVALLATTNGNITAWGDNDTRVYSQKMQRPSEDTFSTMALPGGSYNGYPNALFCFAETINVGELKDEVNGKADAATVETKADKSDVLAIQNEISYPLTIEPEGGTNGVAAFKYAVYNGAFFPNGGKINSISIKSRTNGSLSPEGGYVAVFQQQQDNTSTNPSTWEFKGISTNCPAQTAFNTFTEYEFDDLYLQANKHVSILITTDPNLSSWVVGSTLLSCSSKQRVAPDDISSMTGGSTIAHFPTMKYSINTSFGDKVREIIANGGAVTKNQLASSMDDNDLIPTVQMVKDYIASL